MKQKATVVETYGKCAVVTVDRTSMCDGCHKNECSDGCAMYKIFGAKSSFSAKALNCVDAVKGDIVLIESSDRRINISAFFVFLLPIIIAAALYFATPFIHSEAVRMLISVGSFILYFIVLGITEKARKDRSPEIMITQILTRSDD